MHLGFIDGQQIHLLDFRERVGEAREIREHERGIEIV